MIRAAQVLGYRLLVSIIASTALACLLNFQPQRTRFAERFLYGFWRFALPAWLGEASPLRFLLRIGWEKVAKGRMRCWG